MDIHLKRKKNEKNQRKGEREDNGVWSRILWFIKFSSSFLNRVLGSETSCCISGNELTGNGVGAGVAADQYASDINTLQSMVQKIYASYEAKPLVIGPGGFFDASWYTEFIDKTLKSLQVVTHHIYNLGPGILSVLVISLHNFSLSV